MLRTTAGPDPGVGTSAPSIRESSQKGPQHFTERCCGKLLTRAPSVRILIDMQDLKTLSVKGCIINILGFMGHIASLTAAAFPLPSVLLFPFLGSPLQKLSHRLYKHRSQARFD